MSPSPIFPAPGTVHRCVVCGRPLARRMRRCPYCGEDVPVREPWGLPRWSPEVVYLAAVSISFCLLPPDGGFWNALSVLYPAAFASRTFAFPAVLALLLLFLPPVVAEPGAPLETACRRMAKEALWRMAYLAATLLAVSVVAVSFSLGSRGALAAALAACSALVLSVPFHGLPGRIYGVCPFFLAAFLA